MRDNTVIDNSINEVSIRLFSRLSIVLFCILITPIVGAVFYCINLYRVKKSKRIFGVIAAVIFIFWCIVLPFMGMTISKVYFYLLLITTNFIVGIFLTQLFWKKDFQKTEYREVFPWLAFISLITVFIGYNAIDYFNPDLLDLIKPTIKYLRWLMFPSVFIIWILVLLTKFLVEFVISIFRRFRLQ